MGSHPPLLLSIPTLLPSWVFLYEKAYQVRDTAIESSVVTKVKGFGRYANRVMDVSDYVTPPQVWPPLPRNRCVDAQTLGRLKGRGRSKEGAHRIPRPEPVASVMQSAPSPAAGRRWGSLGLPARVQHGLYRKLSCN